jgi:hypothetical protein
MTAAALGTSVTLKTLDGDEDISIKPGTQGGTVIPLRAHGVPHLRGAGRGDLYVHVEVLTPTKLDDEQEELLRRLSRLRGEERKPGAVVQRAVRPAARRVPGPVTAPVFLVEPGQLAGDEVGSTAPRAGTPLWYGRVTAGERVDLADGLGTIARCEVVAVEQVSLRLRVLERVTEPEPSPRLVVVQALPKADRGELAVQVMTEVGVDEVVPWSAARSIVEWHGARGREEARALAVVGRGRRPSSRDARGSRWFPRWPRPRTSAPGSPRRRSGRAARVGERGAGRRRRFRREVRSSS